VDVQVAALVPTAAARQLQYVSATDVLYGTAPIDDLKNKIVLVGTTTPGLFDLRATPVAGVFPGVEIHANLITGMLDGKIKQKPPYVLAPRWCCCCFRDWRWHWCCLW
jgi:adenylate cyclase